MGPSPGCRNLTFWDRSRPLKNWNQKQVTAPRYSLHLCQLPSPLPLPCVRLSVPTHQVSPQVLVWHTRTEKANLANEPKYHLDTVTIEVWRGYPAPRAWDASQRVQTRLLSPFVLHVPLRPGQSVQYSRGHAGYHSENLTFIPPVWPYNCYNWTGFWNRWQVPNCDFATWSHFCQVAGSIHHKK